MKKLFCIFFFFNTHAVTHKTKLKILEPKTLSDKICKIKELKVVESNSSSLKFFLQTQQGLKIVSFNDQQKAQSCLKFLNVSFLKDGITKLSKSKIQQVILAEFNRIENKNL